jgi:hypothetical protein
MKKVFVFYLLIWSVTMYGQGYKSLVTEADKYYNDKAYIKSVEKYKEAFKLDKTKRSDLYNAACSAALAKEEKLAFKWLELALKNGWTNIRHLKSDKDLNSLHDKKKWDKLLTSMQKEVDKIEANYDKPLQAELLAINEDDQGIRREFIEAQKTHGFKSAIVDSLGRIMMYKDSINLM